MKIIFVRHGESKHNAGLTEEKDVGLTGKGKIQAKHLGMRLKKQKISAIYTSNLLRAKETGEIISKIINVPVKGHFEELNEYSGKHLRSRLRILFNWRLKRLKKFLKKISKERGKNKTILIVVHGVTNRIIIGTFLQIPLRQMLRFRQHNAGLNVISWNKKYNNWEIDSFNDIEHLPGSIREAHKKL